MVSVLHISQVGIYSLEKQVEFIPTRVLIVSEAPFNDGRCSKIKKPPIELLRHKLNPQNVKEKEQTHEAVMKWLFIRCSVLLRKFVQ